MTTHRTLTRRAAAAAVAVSAALVLAACGGNDSGTPTATSAPSASTPSAHNDADVSFAQGMIPHHRQAVEMADLAATRASSADVKALSATIKKAQDPEIRTMSGWLDAWGEEVPADGSTDHAGHSMPGMMNTDDMTRLEQSSGAAFDTAFLELMVKHHEGAVAMAKTEKAKGASPAAKKVADDIITSQSAEITRMNALLDKADKE